MSTDVPTEESYESELELIDDSDDVSDEALSDEDSDYDGGDGFGGNDDESEEDFVIAPQVNWKTAISGISVSTTSQSQQPVYNPQVYTPQPQVYTPQPAFVVEIVPPESTQVHPQVRLEKVGRNFLIQSPPGFFTQYRQYLEALRGTYEEFLQGQVGGSSMVGQWTFRSNQEDEIRSLMARILSGELPPPDQLRPANQINIDMSNTTIVPTTYGQWGGGQNTQIIQSNAFAGSSGLTGGEKKSGRGRGKGKAQPQIIIDSIPPSQIIASTMGPQTIPISAPSVMNQGDKEAFLPAYDPVKKEPGESQAEYEVRKYLYQHLLTNYQMSPDDADKLSRMRNNVDIQGNGYNQNAMMVLNTYLPR